jgi:hypothetical protein
MDHALARQVIGQGAPSRSYAGGLDGGGNDRGGSQTLGLVDLQRLDSEFELLDAGLQLLERDAELCPLETREFAAQLLDECVGVDGFPRHADNHALERIDVIGE